MGIKKAELIDGIYTWDNNITKSEWISVLQDKSLIKEETKSSLYKFYLEPGHRSTCRKLGQKHNIDSNIIQNSINALGKAIQKKLNRFQIIGSDKEPTYWVIPMYGELNNRTLEWVIRPELVEAMETLYVDGNPLHEKMVQPIGGIHQTPEERAKTNFSIKDYVSLLKKSKNLVLTGVIGTGKTYLAKQIAEKMQAEYNLVRFHAAYSYSDFIEGLRPTTWWENSSDHTEEHKDGDFTIFCKKALQNLLDSQKTVEELKEEKSIFETMTLFTETMRDKIFQDGHYLLECAKIGKKVKVTSLNRSTITVYTDQGESLSIPWGNMVNMYKTYKKHKNIGWSLSEIEKYLEIYHHHIVFFLFLKVYDKFQEENLVEVDVDVVERKDFVFIIDEMNNANIIKVFGEACTTLDPENRGPKGKVKTKLIDHVPGYDLFHDGFYIPENVYIIGTMNDVSSESRVLDFDTIKKFTWKEIKVKDRLSMWDDLIPEYKDEAYRIMTTINKRIDNIPGLNELYHIGPSYFLKLKYFDGDFEQFWDNYLEGILTRYLINLPDHPEIISELKESCKKQQKQIAV